MNILFIGLPYFSKKLSEALAIYDTSLQCSSLTIKNGLLGRLALYCGVFRCDLVYSVSGTISTRGTTIFDFALALRKKLIMHWVGTDVLEAISAFKSGKYKSKFLNDIIHYCEVGWIQEELRQIGIAATVVPFASFDGKIAVKAEFPPTFSILTYVSSGREQFYGIDMLIQLAKDFPDVAIKIVGISVYSEKLPNNITLLGWVEDMAGQYATSVLYLRVPEHDGLAFSVLEALANGRYVGYSYPFENTFHVRNYEDLKGLVTDLKASFENGDLSVNYKGMSMISMNYDKETVFENLIKRIKAVHNG